MTIKNFDPNLTGQSAGTLLTKANSAGGSNTAFDIASASGINYATLNSELVAQIVAPTTSELVGWYHLGTSIKVIYLINIGTMPLGAEWIFHRSAYGTVAGTEVAAAFSCSLKNSATYGFGSTIIDPSTSAAWLSTYIPTAGEYRVEINATLTTWRMRVFTGRSSTTAVVDSGVLTPATAIVPSGSSYVTTRSFKYDGNTLSGNLSLLRLGYRDGTDVSTAAEPYAGLLGVTGTLTPANPQLRTVQRTLTLTATGGNGNALTYQVDNWGDGTSSPVQSSNVFTKTYAAAVNGNISFTVNQA